MPVLPAVFYASAIIPHVRDRNRHCPKCQGNKREEWIAKREEELLPVPYFHLVFTLPDLLNPLALHQPKQLYDTLFEAAWKTLETMGADHKHLGAQTGMVAVLHTCLTRA